MRAPPTRRVAAPAVATPKRHTLDQSVFACNPDQNTSGASRHSTSPVLLEFDRVPPGTLPANASNSVMPNSTSRTAIPAQMSSPRSRPAWNAEPSTTTAPSATTGQPRADVLAPKVAPGSLPEASAHTTPHNASAATAQVTRQRASTANESAPGSKSAAHRPAAPKHTSGKSVG